jgi:twinkle protein
MTLSVATIEFFERRGISPDLISRFEIYTGARDANGTVVANARGRVIVFPFVEHGNIVNEKYRGPQKSFWHRKGGKRTFWNVDALDDPALETGLQPLVITEGIEDALSAIECGYPLTVSVPDGAPPESAEPLPVLNPEAEKSGKFEFMWHNRDRLRRVRRFIIATDSDGPGQRLAAEMVRRLAAGRCQFVTYPDGCKDLNDVLVQYGRDAVIAVLRDAKPYPVRGLYRLSEYPSLAPIEPVSVGWSLFDGECDGNGWMKLFAGEFVVVTGVPSHGKSTWTLNLLYNLARDHGWRSAIFSPEMPTVPFLRDKLRRIIGVVEDEPDEFIERHFVFIDHDPTDNDDDDVTLEWIIDKARDAVLRDGIRVLVIDPWNEVEHARQRDESMAEYIGRAIRMLKRFARQYEVVVIVLAHPTKDVFDRGNLRKPTLYDIDGSAHWFNKPDHGIVIWRDPVASEAIISISKVRFEQTGYRGDIRMRFSAMSQRFMSLDPGP